MIKILYLNNERLVLDLDKMIILGNGKEGVVYKYNSDKCIKIFNADRNSGQLLKINEEKFKLFTTLKTDRIILPSNLLYNSNNQIEGYLMKYIDDKFSIEYIRNKNIIEVINELNDLKKDIDILSDNDILINDLKYQHLLYDSGFYLIDSSLYSKYQYDKVLCYKAEYRNIYLMNEFLIGILLKQRENISDFGLDFNDIPYIYRQYQKQKFVYVADTIELEANKHRINNLNELRLIYKKGLNSLKNK